MVARSVACPLRMQGVLGLPDQDGRHFNYAMYTTVKSSIVHMTWSYEELKSLLLYVI